MLEQLTGLANLIGEDRACREMRKHVGQYLKGVTGSVKVKRLTSQAVKIAQYKDALSLLDY